MQARVRLGWRLHEAPSDSMPVTSLCSGMRRALLCGCLFATVFDHAAPPHLNEAPPPWPAWGLSSFAVYSGSDSSPPLGMAAGCVPQAPKFTLAGRLQMLTPLDVGWCTLTSTGPLLLYSTPADDLQLRTAPEVWCAPSCRPAPEGAAMLDRFHHGMALRAALWLICRCMAARPFHHAEQCSKQATHLHVTKCPGCTQLNKGRLAARLT